jgi:adenosylcobinamide kinase/adenosylcobinamide-phosphate guanylyltransferase
VPGIDLVAEVGAHRKLILVGGGARSGKSRYALQRARELGERRVFIATAERSDDEMAIRIQHHRVERGSEFRTIEEPLALPEALKAAGPTADTIVVDCLTLWVSNLLIKGAGDTELAARFQQLEDALLAARPHVVLVSNEVGMGLVPDTPLGRQFRDAIGTLHQRLAARADELYVATMGVLLRLRPAPMELVPRMAETAA